MAGALHARFAFFTPGMIAPELWTGTLRGTSETTTVRSLLEWSVPDESTLAELNPLGRVNAGPVNVPRTVRAASRHLESLT